MNYCKIITGLAAITFKKESFAKSDTRRNMRDDFVSQPVLDTKQRGHQPALFIDILPLVQK
jgi:hypothetical protein